MARYAEKNDVDVSTLFKWKKSVDIEDGITGNKATFYIRLVGDAELTRARTYGYRKAADLRKALRTDGSDERAVFLSEIGDYADKKQLVGTVILLEVPKIYQDSIRGINFPEPKEPRSDASQEDWEEYQKKVDSYPQDFDKLVFDAVAKTQKDREKELNKLSMEDLHNMYEREVINRLCEEELQNSYYDMCVYLATFIDKEYKSRAFKTFDEYDNVHSTLKTKLRAEYQSLEIGTDILKKLPGATA